jgi:predicted TIM-barrel fold metal-dependent hydrolase
MKIIDTHQHLWDLDRLVLPWLKPGGKLTRSFLMHDYLAAIEGLNFDRAVYMEVAATTSHHLIEAEYVLSLMDDPKNLTVAAVLGGRPADERFGDYVARFKSEKRVKGFRQIVHVDETPPGYCVSDNFIRGVRVLGELGKSFDICIRPAELGDAVKLVDACPNTRFILDHCGNGDPFAFMKNRTANVKPLHTPEQFKRDINELAKRDRVVCKISGIVARMEGHHWTAGDLAPVINCCLDAFSPDRVIFASDWPVCTLAASLRQWVEALKSIVSNHPLQQQEKLFHDNAKRLYGI